MIRDQWPAECERFLRTDVLITVDHDHARLAQAMVRGKIRRQRLAEKPATQENTGRINPLVLENLEGE